MADHKSGTRDPVTIVGGRPMHRAVSTADLPMGLEQVLTVAGLNYRFRLRLARDPVAAAAEMGIELDQTEVMLLRSAGPERVAEMARRTVPPTNTRRRFIKNVAASVAAMVAGEAFLLCSGCTGADSWTQKDIGAADRGAKPAQLVSTLAGHVCYLYVPGKVLSDMGSPHPVLVALHDESETALAHSQRWYGAADAYGFSIVSVNWTETQKKPAELEQLARDLSAVAKAFAKSYPVDSDRRYLCSRGNSTSLVYKAALLHDSGFWAAALLLGGVPADSCSASKPAGVVANHPALYYLLGQQDADFARGEACVKMFETIYGKDGPFHKEQISGATTSAVLKFDELWQWLAQYGAGGRKR